MACRSDHMMPTPNEKESKRVLELLFYVYRQMKRAYRTDIPEDIKIASQTTYGRPNSLDEDTAHLCRLIASMNEGQKDLWLWDGRNPKARRLADWWDEHSEADKKRVAAEEAAKKLKHEKNTVLKKLSLEERTLLGLPSEY